MKTTIEICKSCGEKYKDCHVVPRAPYAPFYCDKCMEELNRTCGGSWVSAVYQASSKKSPMERGGS